MGSIAQYISAVFKYHYWCTLMDILQARTTIITYFSSQKWALHIGCHGFRTEEAVVCQPGEISSGTVAQMGLFSSIWAPAQKAQFEGSVTLPLHTGWKELVLSRYTAGPVTSFSLPVPPLLALSASVVSVVIPTASRSSFLLPLSCSASPTHSPIEQIAIRRLGSEEKCHIVSCYWPCILQISCDSFLLRCLPARRQRQSYFNHLQIC